MAHSPVLDPRQNQPLYLSFSKSPFRVLLGYYSLDKKVSLQFTSVLPSARMLLQVAIRVVFSPALLLFPPGAPTHRKAGYRDIVNFQYHGFGGQRNTAATKHDVLTVTACQRFTMLLAFVQ